MTVDTFQKRHLKQCVWMDFKTRLVFVFICLTYRDCFTLPGVLISISCGSNDFHALFAKIQFCSYWVLSVCCTVQSFSITRKFWKVCPTPQRPAPFSFSFALSSLPFLVPYSGKLFAFLGDFAFIFRLGLLVFILKCLATYKSLGFLRKSETTSLYILCSLEIPWGFSPFLSWLYLHTCLLSL